MPYVTKVLEKMETYSSFDGKERTWTRKNVELFRKWYVKFLARHPAARKELMNAPDEVSNIPAVLDRYTKVFIMKCGFKVKD